MKSGVLSKKTKDTGCFGWNHRGLIYLFEVSSMCLVTAYISIYPKFTEKAVHLDLA